MSVFFTDLDNTLIYSHKREIGEEKTVVEYLDGRQQSFMTNYTYKYLKNAKWLDIVPVTTRIDTQFKRITCMNELNIKEAIVGNGGMLLLNGNEDEEWSAKTLDIASKQISSLDKIEAKLRNDYPLAVIYRPTPYMLYLRRDSQSDIFNRLEDYAKEMDLTFQQAHRKLYLFCKGIDKGKAVERYKKRRGVNIDVAAGDDIMDIPMLNLARFAFASEKIAPYVKNENLFVFEGELISDRICDELQRLHISGKI